MALTSVFVGEKGYVIKHKIWQILMNQDPDKEKVTEQEIMEFAQDFLLRKIDEEFDVELKKALAGAFYYGREGKTTDN